MGSLYIPWLVDAARLTGYPVVDVPGHRARGHGGMRAVEGVTGHHTADGPGEYPSLFIVRDGRSDLAGPLAHLGLGRSGTIYVIAAGLCYHAGASQWAGFLDLNDEFIGIEAESAGTRDDWTDAQHDAYPRLVAALLHFMRRDASRFAGHREVCLPTGRKIDPAFLDLPAFRKRVEWLLGDALARIPRFANPPRRPEAEDTSMYVQTDTPADLKSAKKTWEPRWVSFGFDPPKGWGGAGVVKITVSAPGGWIHDAAWWRRADATTAVGVPNKPHERISLTVPGGPEQFPGYQRELIIPERCDELELLISAPGGVHLTPYYER
jgi:hypothetical protein